jgi:hypothetical protein
MPNSGRCSKRTQGSPHPQEIKKKIKIDMGSTTSVKESCLITDTQTENTRRIPYQK